MAMVVVNICLGGQFNINCPSAFLKNFKIFKNYEGDLSQKSPEPNMSLLFSHPKQKQFSIETNIF